MSIFYGGSRRSGIFRKRTRRKRVRSGSQRQVVFWWRVVITLAVLLLLALLSSGIYKMTRHPSVTITTIDVKGGETIDAEDVEYRAQELLKGTYLLLIPRSFAYLYPHDDIVAAIERIPRVHSVRVVRDSPTSLEVQFAEYQPFALWCESLHASSTDTCVFLDRSGYAFGEAPQLTGSTFIRIVTQGQMPEIGRQVLPSEELGLLGEFVQALKNEVGMRIHAITKTEEGDVHYHITGGGEIIVSATASLQDTFDTLASVLDSEAFLHIAPGNFEYIDLRFDNKVYVKEVSQDEAEIDAAEDVDAGEGAPPEAAREENDQRLLGRVS